MMMDMNLVEKVRELVKSKLDRNNEAMVTYEDGTQYFFKSYDGYDWHLYKGCDLVVGDVSFSFAVNQMIVDAMY